MPEPGTELSVSAPPIAAARSRMFRRPWPRLRLVGVEPGAVVAQRDEARRPSRSPIVTQACRAPACLRAFASPSCTIRKTSICSSGPEPDRSGSISSSTSSAPSAVRKSTYRRSAASNGERPDADESARIANRASCCAASAASFEARQGLGGIGAGLEHRRVRRDREQVLREAVVDVARDPRPLLGDGAPELGARIARQTPTSSTA